VTAELRAVEGVKQYPLERDRKSFGVINAAFDGSELAIVPEHQILRECGPTGHLIYKVIEPIKKAHSGFDYHVELTSDKVVKWILVRATKESRITEKQILDLRNAARWAFENADKRPDAKPEAT
jgi:hypothetical protein